MMARLLPFTLFLFIVGMIALVLYRIRGLPL